MWRTIEGSTGRLIQLCLGYFLFYVVTGVSVKYFLGSPAHGLPGMPGTEYLVYSTVGGSALAMAIVLTRRWYRLESIRVASLGGLRFPSEFLYIIPSGVCTAVVIPTTTLMYTLPISVMVAMVIMRGSVIVISRAVDAIQIRQGLLDKKVYPEENVAVLFAVAAAMVHLLFAQDARFDFLQSIPALSILGSYIVAYSIRIYIMNYYKNTHAKEHKYDNRAFFGVEQISASASLVLPAVVVPLARPLRVVRRAPGCVSGRRSRVRTPSGRRPSSRGPPSGRWLSSRCSCSCSRGAPPRSPVS